MKHNFKRFLSLLLAFVMVIGMFPMTHAHAEEETALALQKVTSVEDGEQYVIAFAGQSRAVANVTRSWGGGKGNGLDTGNLASLSAIPDSLYLWTMEAADGGFKIRGVKSGTYVSISANNAVLGEDGQVFTFTQMNGAIVIRVKDSNQRFNNLGDENCVGGWDSDSTKFDLYKVTEVADPYGKLRGQWSAYASNTGNAVASGGKEGPFYMAFDNDPTTRWHSTYQGATHQLNGENTYYGVIDLGDTYTLNRVYYTPRQDISTSGKVTQASLYVSTVENPNAETDDDWTLVAEHVIFADDISKKVFSFHEQEVRYVKFVAERSNDGWVTASEFDVEYAETIPVAHMIPTQGSYQPNNNNEGPASYALDGNTNTMWHTNHDGDDRENMWAQFELTEGYTVTALRYLPRSGAGNGTITKYQIQVSNDNETFKTIASGTWARNDEWKTAEFVTTAKYIRLYAEESYSTHGPNFASAAEIRLEGEKHAYDEGVVTVPTCTKQGYTTYTCTQCDFSYNTDYIDINSTAHKWGDWQTVTAATCTTKGSEKRVCEYNGDHVETRETAIDANAHTYGDLIPAQTEVHTQTELKAPVAAHYHCACGKYFTEDKDETTLPELTGEIPEHDNNVSKTENKIEPTLNSAGSYDLVTYCSVCGKEMSRTTETVPALTGAVASVNGTKYATLAEAVAVGGEVKLLANTNGNGIIIDKNVTIDLNNYTYTIDGVLVGSTGTKSCGFQILSGNTVVIKNGAIVMDKDAVRGHDSKVGNNFVIQNYANMTLENVAVTGNAHTSYVVSNNSGNVAFTGNTSITAPEGAVAFDVCKYASYAEPTVTVNTTGTIAGNIEVTGGTLTLTAATINGALVYEAGTVTKAETVTLAAPADYKWVNGVLTAKTYVAQVGDTKYESLAEAVEKAADGATVTLLANTNGNGIIIDKNVTIDLNGKTYTIDGVLVGSTGTKSCGFQILSGNTVVIKNGAIVMDKDAVRGHDKQVGNNFVIQNYANLTLTDVVVTGNSNTSYVVSNNSGNVAFTGNTSITAPEGAVAFDVCKYASYAEPTVTVNTTGTIAGNIEVTGGALTLNAGTFTGALTYTAGKVTKAEAVTLAAPADYKWVNGVLTAKTYVAEADGVKYESLAEAVEKAADGATVTLLANTNGNGIIIDKNITIDLNNYTYTIDGVLVGSTGTKSCGFQILSGKTVTIKNGSIVMGEGAVRGHDHKVGNNFVIQNYANMTLENVTVIGNSYTSYVVSNNSGNVAFTGNTSITAKKAGAVAFDVCKYASYAEPTVTVAETVVIDGKIEAAAKVGNVYYATFEKALASGNEITLLVPVTVTKDTTYDLTGKTIISKGDAFVATSGTLTLNGDGIIKAGTAGVGSWCAVWANGGHVDINGGTYSVGGDRSTTDVNHQNDLIYTKNGGTVTINGGTFLYTEGVWTLNQNDKTGGKIVVYGGTFYKWNPANNNSEGPNTSFVAEGYCSAPNDEGNYTVQKHAEAEAVVENNVAPTCGAKGSYDTVIYCSICNAELSRETTTVPATGHTAGEAVVENETATSYESVVYCSVCKTELSREIVQIPVVEPKVVLHQMQVYLEAEIQMEYTMAIPEELVNAGAYVVMTKDGRWGKVTKEYKSADLAACLKDGIYAVTIGVASGEMTRGITVQVFDGEGNALTLYNKSNENLGTSETRTVVDFAKSVLNNPESTDVRKNLAIALVTYGGYAQKNFNVSAEEPAYDLLNELELAQMDLSKVTVDDVDKYTNNQTNLKMGVKATQTEAVLDSYISYRVYLTVEGDISNYTFKVVTPTGEKELKCSHDAKRGYYVEIPDIASGYIDYAYKLTVTNAAGDTNEITTSVLAYVRSVLRNTNNSQDKINLAKALYLYNQAANEFFGE